MFSSVNFIPGLDYAENFMSDSWRKCDHDVLTKFSYYSPLHLALIFVQVVITQFHQIIYILQIFEWHVMIHIIEAQKSKTIEEFMYDFNTENTQIKIKDEKKENLGNNNVMTFKREEMNIEKLFLPVFLLTNLIHFVLDILTYQNIYANLILTIIYVIQALLFCYYHRKVFNLMRKKHRYEFERTRTQLIAYRLIFILFYLTRMAYIIGMILFLQFDSREKQL